MDEKPSQPSPATLGDVLYADAKAPVPEREWAALVRSVAAGDEAALHALYERAHRPVFTLMIRLTANRETAEELTVDVFHDVWRRASGYDPRTEPETAYLRVTPERIQAWRNVAELKGRTIMRGGRWADGS
jgi:hypothetical protein